MADKTPGLPPAALKALGEIRELVVERKQSLPRLGDLANAFFELCGGPRALAKLMLDEYHRPTCPPLVRSRIIDIVLGALRFAEQQDGGLGDLQHLSKEDLDRALDEAVKKAVPLGEAAAQTGDPGA